MSTQPKARDTTQLDERLQTPQMVDAAADLTRYILQGAPERLAHSEAVARRAEFLTLAVDREAAPQLVAAAWLHDIGYAPELQATGFHPVDGARFLSAAGWPPELCSLVAHHSGARFVAATRHLDHEPDPYPFTQDPLTDALTVADQTVGPHGEPMTVEERLTDMLTRHGPDSPNARAHPAREPCLRGAATRVAAALHDSGVDHRIT